MQVTRATFLPLLAPAEPERLAEGAVLDEYCGDLAIMYSFGPPFGKRIVTHADLQRMDLSRRVLRRTALEQLESLAGRAQFHGQPPALMLSFDGFESSLLLAEAFWMRMRASVPGELVVGVPARDVVIVTGSQSSAGLEKARRAVDRVYFAGDENLLSRRLLVRRGGMWEPFDGPTRPPAGRPAPHPGDQRPRQYQDHVSWPGERVPVAAMHPISPVDRTAPPPTQRRPMPGRPVPVGSVPGAAMPGPMPGLMPTGPVSAGPGPMPMGPMPSGPMPMGPMPTGPSGPMPMGGPVQTGYHTGDIPRPMPYGQPGRGGQPQPSYTPAAKPSYRDDERGYAPTPRPADPREYGHPGQYGRPVPGQPAGPAHPVSAMPQAYPASGRHSRTDWSAAAPTSSAYPYSAPPASAPPMRPPSMGPSSMGPSSMGPSSMGAPPVGAPQSAVPYPAPYSAVPYSAAPASAMPYSSAPYRTGSYPEAAPYSAPPASQQTGPVYPASWGASPDAAPVRPAWDGRTGARARFSR